MQLKDNYLGNPNTGQPIHSKAVEKFTTLISCLILQDQEPY
ncbi:MULTISPECIES: hypothetical protein [unclassified Myroides]